MSELRERLKSIMFEQVRTTFSMKHLTNKQANKRLDDRVDEVLAAIMEAVEGLPLVDFTGNGSLGEELRFTQGTQKQRTAIVALLKEGSNE